MSCIPPRAIFVRGATCSCCRGRGGRGCLAFQYNASILEPSEGTTLIYSTHSTCSPQLRLSSYAVVAATHVLFCPLGVFMPSSVAANKQGQGSYFLQNFTRSVSISDAKPSVSQVSSESWVQHETMLMHIEPHSFMSYCTVHATQPPSTLSVTLCFPSDFRVS